MVVSHDEEESPKKKCWKLYFDGVSNTLGHDISAVLITSKREYYPFRDRLDFNCTDSVAEDEAYVMGLQVALDKGIKKLEVYEDSTLIIYQLRREYETRDSFYSLS